MMAIVERGKIWHDAPSDFRSHHKRVARLVCTASATFEISPSTSTDCQFRAQRPAVKSHHLGNSQKGKMLPTLPVLRATSRSARNAKRLQTGLYDGRSIQSGNAIGETFNSKTRRTWAPNVQTKTVWSEAMNKGVKLRVTTGALRTMDKVGGLDQYLFRMRPERLGDKGMQLRQMVSFQDKAHTKV